MAATISEATAKRAQKMRARALAAKGLRWAAIAQTAAAPEFRVAYARPKPANGTPVVVLPGGPGMASMLPYARFRARAAKRGIDTIMMDHRGVGLSRADIDGNDLPPSAIDVASAAGDIAAILDAEGIEQAVIAGSSYGSYLAGAFGALFPERVAGMILDSAVLSARDHLAVGEHARELLWDGLHDESADIAALVRDAHERLGEPLVELCAAVRAVYEFGGPELARRFLRQHSRGKASRAWRFLTRARENELSRQMPHCLEMDLVGRITFRELGFAHGVEDCPFNFAAQFAELAEGFEPFQGENFDLPAAMPGFHWPTVVLSGEHDLRTPRPHAQRTVALLPDAVLGRLTGTGHSALDTHQRALLHAIERMAAGQHRHVAADTGLMAGLSRVGTSPFSLGKVVGALLMADRLLPRRPLPVRGSLGRAVEA